MAFVVHNDLRADAALTVHAAALGYGRFVSSPPDTGLLNSLAFELDTYNNANWNDTDGNHVSVHTNATAENTQDEVFSIGEAQPAATLKGGQVHTARVCYVPGTLEVFIDDLTNPILSLAYDFTSGGNWTNGNPVGGLDLINGTSAWVGFTASNGGSAENHDLLSWEWGQCGSGTPLCFGDGIRCCGQNVVRIGTYLPAGSTTDTLTRSLIGGVGGPVSAHPGNAGLQAGDTRRYQWWYRDPGGSNPCGVDFFNLSNAVGLTWGA